MAELVHWNILYSTSILMFVLSLVIFPFNPTWSIIIIFSLISIWSTIPGLIHFIFNQMALNDFFTFVIAAYVNGIAGGLFGAFTMLSRLAFGTEEWPPYIFRTIVALFIASLSVPFIVSFTGGVTLTTFFIYEGINYVVYFGLVLLFFRDEIGLELSLLPVFVFFDLFMNAFLLKIFGRFLDDLITGGIASGWVFLVFAGIIIGFVILSKNSNRIGRFLESIWNRRGGKSEETNEENFAEELDKGEEF